MKKKNLITWWILIVLLISMWLIIFQYKKNLDTEYYNSLSQEEQDKIKIDEYNFEQLEKVKAILDPLDKDSYNFNNLKEFNEKFNQNIKPIKNCYYLIDKNSFFRKNKGPWGYIFWFELESNMYIKKYGTKYYAYPNYDLPNDSMCIWWWWQGDWWWCFDRYRSVFESTISNPCQD